MQSDRIWTNLSDYSISYINSIVIFRRSSMKTVALWTLAAMNVVLLASFTSRMIKPNTANADVANSRPGDYLMIPGSVVGGVNDVVYVLDQTHHLLSFMSYDDSRKIVLTSSPRDLDRDFDGLPNTRWSINFKRSAIQEFFQHAKNNRQKIFRYRNFIAHRHRAAHGQLLRPPARQRADDNQGS